MPEVALTNSLKCRVELLRRVCGGGDSFGVICVVGCFFFSSRRRHTRFDCDWSSDVCSSDLHCRSALSWMDAESSDRMAVAGYRRGLSRSVYAVEKSSSHLHIYWSVPGGDARDRKSVV